MAESIAIADTPGVAKEFLVGTSGGITQVIIGSYSAVQQALSCYTSDNILLRQANHSTSSRSACKCRQTRPPSKSPGTSGSTRAPWPSTR